MGGYEHDIETFKQAVKQINELDPDFVILCGDLVNNANDSTYADFMSIMKGFKVPCYLAPGNHDVGNVPNNETLSYYRKTIGEDYYNFQNKKHSFIVTNTQLWKAQVDHESEKHDKWFENTLKSECNKQHPTFVIGHFPLYTESPEEKEHYFNLPLTKRKRILELLKKYNVTAYLSGHSHKFITHNYEGIQLVSGETTSKNFDDRPMGFRLWHVFPSSAEHHFVELSME